MDEFWVNIPNHPDYEINNYGDIRYCDTEIMVRLTVNRGYFRVRLDGKRYYVHQLMMLSFYPDEQNGHYIKHIDGDKSNNCLSNLCFAGPFSDL